MTKQKMKKENWEKVVIYKISFEGIEEKIKKIIEETLSYKKKNEFLSRKDLHRLIKAFGKS